MSRYVDDLRHAANLAEAFASVVARQPQQKAVTLGARTVTYSELDAMSTRIAIALASQGVVHGDIVALVCDRSIELIAAMLGAWKAGVAYLPIDPRYPAARIEQTIADCGPKIVLADSVSLASGSIAIAELLRSTDSEETPRPISGHDDLAYLIYTSGSTGRPKGVMVTQANVLRLLTETDAWFGFDSADVWTMFHSPAFDFSVWEIWGALLTGGRLVIVPYETCRDPEAVCALIESENVTILNQSPAAFSLLMQAESCRPESVRSLRLVIFGGEALNLRSLLPWFERHGEERPALINMYGITETTVHVTFRRILRADAEHETDSLIGVPIPDLSLHILDDKMKPAEEGELFVGGAGVALGYWNRPELTAERFLANPFGPGKLYRSGDLVRRRADGELVYLGRGDRQMNLRGFRIELGEVEAVLLRQPGVGQVVADVSTSTGTLIAFFTGKAAAHELSEHAAVHLPEHMRPTRFVAVSGIPLTINGKIDRVTLAAMANAESFSVSTMSTGTSLENQVAQVWQHVLGLNAAPDFETNFFEAGGSSLLLHALRRELEQKIARPVGILQLFQYPTIRSLAAALDSSAPTLQEENPRAPSRPGFRPLRNQRKVALR